MNSYELLFYYTNNLFAKLISFNSISRCSFHQDYSKAYVYLVINHATNIELLHLKPTQLSIDFVFHTLLALRNPVFGDDLCYLLLAVNSCYCLLIMVSSVSVRR